MIERVLEIVNERGLHARAAAKFVSLAGTFLAEVTVSKDGNSVSGSSILGLMTLSASRGSQIEIRVEGTDEAVAADALSRLVSGGFDETD